MTGGRQKTLLEYLDFLKESDVEISIYSFDKRDMEHLPEIEELHKRNEKIKTIKILSLPPGPVVAANVLFHSFIRRRKSLQESSYYSGKIRRFFHEEVKRKGPDIIFCDVLRTAQFFQSKQLKNALRIYDMDDILSKRYLYLRGTDGNILGSMSDRFPTVVKSIVEKYCRKPLMSFEALLVAKSEIRYAEKFEKTLLVSPHEAEEMRKITGKSTIYYLYPSAEKQSDCAVFTEENRYLLSYMGYFGNPNNEKGLLLFLANIFPLLLQRFSSTQLTVIGVGVTAELHAAFKKAKAHINYCGYVPDYRPVLRETNVFIAPIYYGTGIKTKVIDAMSLGMPVAATVAAIEGLHVKNEEDLLVAETDGEFVENISRLFQEEALNNRIRKNALHYIEKFHEKKSLQKKFLDLLEVQ